MKKFMMFMILLTFVLSATACGAFSKSEPPAPTPVTQWSEAPFDPDSAGLGAVFGSDTDDDTSSSDTTANSFNTDLFGTPSPSGWSAEDLGLSGMLPIEDDDNSLDFFFGMPIETGNEFDDDFPVLESGLPLETGTNPQMDFTPESTPLPFETNDDDRISYAEEELQRPPQDLPKTSDLFTSLLIAIISLSALVLLIIFVKRKGVRA